MNESEIGNAVRIDHDSAILMSDAVYAIGYVSSELASRAGAWDNKAPDWFPEPPEWLELFEKGLVQAYIHREKEREKERIDEEQGRQ